LEKNWNVWYITTRNILLVCDELENVIGQQESKLGRRDDSSFIDINAIHISYLGANPCLLYWQVLEMFCI
jgi:hypothetical protein